MIDEWFKDALKSFKHQRLSDIPSLRGSFRAGKQAVLRRLEIREGMRFVVIPEALDHFRKAATILTVIENSEVPFMEEWTSFRSDEELIFAFKNASDAVRFKLLWEE